MRKGAYRSKQPRTIDPTDKASTEWLDSLKATTKPSYIFHWSKFLEFTRMTGDEILSDRKVDTEHRWERKVVSFKQWLENQGIHPNSARTATITARSFFGYHYHPIVLRPQECKKVNEAYRKNEDYRFSREDLKRMADVGNLTEQYVVVAGKSLGLRANDFWRLTRGNLEPYLTREAPVCIGPITTQKEHVPAYPFIDSDAIPVVKMMLEHMNREGRIDPNDRMLKYKKEMTIDAIVKRVAKKAGIANGNRVVRFHGLRKFLCDHLASNMSESKWKQMVGKKIGEGAYVSADSLRDDYIRTMAETTFVEASTVNENDMRIKVAIDNLRQSGRFSDSTLKQMEAEWLGKEPAIAIPNIIIEAEALERIAAREGFDSSKEGVMIAKDYIAQEMEVIKRERSKPKVQHDGGCKDGKHCQRVVTESELEILLTQGWHVVMGLPSGKVIISD